MCRGELDINWHCQECENGGETPIPVEEDILEEDSLPEEIIRRFPETAVEAEVIKSGIQRGKDLLVDNRGFRYGYKCTLNFYFD